MRMRIGRRGRYVVIAASILSAMILAGGLTFLRLQPAHASGTGGGGCSSPDGTPVCSFHGSSAFAFFQSSTDCVSTGANLFVSDDVTRNPPNAGTGGPMVAMGLQTVDFCGGPSVFAFSGEATNVSFSVVAPLKSATLTATVPMIDEFDPTHTFNVTVNVTWQGFGTTSMQIDSSHFRTGNTIFSSHFKATSRDARALGSITDGTTEYAQGPTIFNDIQTDESGTISVIHA